MSRFPVIYTEGKVGTQTYAEALRRAGLEFLFTHSLRPERLRKRIDRAESAGEARPPGFVQDTLKMRSRIIAEPGRFAFVTGVRDPVERRLSGFFQNWSRHLPDLNSADPENAETAVETFLRDRGLGRPDAWFDKEFNGVLGADLLEPHPDPGPIWRLKTPIHVLILRIDAPDADKEAALSGFLGCDIRLARRNRAADKPYAETYRRFLDGVRFPADALAEIYDSRMARRFWSEAERAALIEKWAQ